jgi:hypothetical protein
MWSPGVILTGRENFFITATLQNKNAESGRLGVFEMERVMGLELAIMPGKQAFLKNFSPPDPTGMTAFRDWSG